MTRTSSCSSSCFRGTSSRRQCRGYIHYNYSYRQIFPHPDSSSLCPPLCRSHHHLGPLSSLQRPWHLGEEGAAQRTFLSLAANKQGSFLTSLYLRTKAFTQMWLVTNLHFAPK
ncbi:hypothetical protein I79_025354 [Cricetulus griseus]|uniref:Uncharacterized protein n=1 Tax=Cricetulus griseus TaxID=10029 RepID=G3IN42_CRIGR|nr:hypothetical protein I79_025354 [Cricetulus griseus]